MRYYTTSEWEAEVGRQVRTLRLQRNLDQRVLAERAAISHTTLKNLEAGRGATLGTLIKVVRALGRADWLEALAPNVTINPLQMLKSAATQRQRVFARRPSYKRKDGHGDGN